MIDNLALAISHVLILIAAIRLLGRPDLDDDSAPAPDPAAKPNLWRKPGWGRRDA